MQFCCGYGLLNSTAAQTPQVIISMLRTAMVKSGAKSFLIDGFPRALDQAEAFERLVKPCDKVLFFDCPEEVMEARLIKRGETSGRADDNADTIRKRFKTFVEQSLPVIDHYEAQGKAFKISAVPAPDIVFEDVCRALNTPVEVGLERHAAAQSCAPCSLAWMAQVHARLLHTRYALSNSNHHKGYSGERR